MNIDDAFEKYLLAVKNTPLDQQTEMTSRAALEALLNTAASEFAQIGTRVTHEPTREKAGAPDFKVVSKGMILGYVENKAIGEDLKRVAKSDQIAKYLKLSPNILITDYLHWLWIGPNGTQEARLIEASALEAKTVNVRPERAVEVTALLRGFFSEAPQPIGRAKALAEALATRSQMLRDYLGEELVRQERAKSGGVLMGLYGAFREQVSHEITLKEFADAFAQTLAYGLFLAKLNTKPGDTITLLNAKQYVAASFGLIQELVGFLDRLDQPNYADIRWVVEEVLSIINNLNLATIHEDLSFRGRKARRGTRAGSEEEHRLFERDPFIYFYEDYLAKYDAKMRKSRGVYYTPPPIVNFIVRAINDILKDTFGIAEGLANRKRVTVLDFATGTGTFLVEVLERIFEEIGGSESGKAPLVIREHILKNIYGFEYLIAPYTIAHLKLSQYLTDQGHELEKGERFQVYLTNTLEPIDPEPNYLVPELSHETEAAQAVKDKSILVITGNPPYARHSKNMGPAARRSVVEYRKGIPELNRPAQQKPIQEDYVKFLRFAQMKMEINPEGVVAAITNHSYLGNPTLRGMRRSLMKTFDQIYLIDLHGNKEQPTSPGGAEDKNVFDIKVGVSICVMIKKEGLNKAIKHADIWGKRQHKYEWAAATALEDVEWTNLDPQEPLFEWTPSDAGESSTFRALASVADIFARSGDPAPGFVSTQDQFAISFNEREAKAKVDQLIGSRDEEEARSFFRLCSTNQWSYDAAKKRLSDVDIDSLIQGVVFRPFDERWTVWTSDVCVHRRERATQHMRRANVALLTARRNRAEHIDHFFVAGAPSEAKAAESSTQSFLFPLYLYAPPEGARKIKADLFGEIDFFAGKERIENIAPAFRNWIDQHYGHSFIPEEIFGFIYAVLYAPAYRSRYADFLRTNFPRIPFPEKRADFEALSKLGWDLAEVHLMRKPPKGASGLGGYFGKGSNEVEKPRRSEADERVWINQTQGFANVPQAVWEFTIGGYPVIDKYLKSRKGRTLSLDEIENVERVANILAFTIGRMGEIDRTYKDAFRNTERKGTADV